MKNKNASEIEGFTIDYDLPLYSGDRLFPLYDPCYGAEFPVTEPLVAVYHRKSDGQPVGHGISPYTAADIPKDNFDEWLEDLYNEACEKFEIPSDCYIRMAVLEKDIVKCIND
jgi:hypothetical protein